jgi:hypothetical protein
MHKGSSILTTTREVTAALGGIKAVASLTGRKYSAAGNWVQDSKAQFPANTYVVLNAALAAIGKSAPPSLWGMKLPEETDA